VLISKDLNDAYQQSGTWGRSWLGPLAMPEKQKQVGNLTGRDETVGDT